MKTLISKFGGAPRRSRQAMSLLDMMVAMGIGSLLMAAVMQTSVWTSRSFCALGNYNDLDRKSRSALDNMTRDIRQARVLSFANTNQMFFTNQDNTWFSYQWDPANKVVTKTASALGSFGRTNTTVLTGCDYFSFSIFMRNPTNQFWFPYSANSQPTLAKLVNVSWRCSRQVVGQYNTESVQTAKIVLRN
jgi:hypothetical protein